MNRTEIAALYADASALGGKTVTVCGWVRSIRDSKALGFIDLNDGSCFKGVQIVFEDSKVENFHEITRQNVGCALRVTGELLLTPQAKQPFEIHAQKIEVEGASTPDYPLQKKRPHHGIFAHHRPSAPAYQYVQRGVPGAFGGGLCHSPLFPGKRVCVCPHASDHRQ